MDPSEKSSPISRADLIGFDTLQGNRKRISETDADQVDKFMCVNPYDVNPFAGRADLQIPLVTIDIPLKGESSAIQDEFYATSGSGFYGTQRKIKLEMEEFGDLSSFLPRHTLTNSIDELNTPIFEKDAFDFDISNFQKNCQTDFFVKLEYDANYRYKPTVSPDNVNIFNEPEEVHRKESIPSEIGSNIHLEQRSGAAMYAAAPDNNGTYIFGASPTDGSPSAALPFDVNDTSAFSVISRHCSSSSYPTSPNGVEEGGGVYQFGSPVTTASPEDSFGGSPDSTQRKLSLDLSLVAPPPSATISTVVSTPNIIADVVDLESDCFNILDLVKDDNITAEDIFVGPTVTLPFLPVDFVACQQQQQQPTATAAKKGAHYEVVAVKQPRKRPRRSEDYDEDDDEEYVPPSAKRKTKQQPPKSRVDFSDSDSDLDAEPRPARQQQRRGRPPKRADSVCSDHSSRGEGGDVASKYRELRDKNNEASRKSRLKRKIKELEIESEAEELSTRNIKLKAQVEELERIVKSYKDNIFKIMLTK